MAADVYCCGKLVRNKPKTSLCHLWRHVLLAQYVHFQRRQPYRKLAYCPLLSATSDVVILYHTRSWRMQCLLPCSRTRHHAPPKTYKVKPVLRYCTTAMRLPSDLCHKQAFNVLNRTCDWRSFFDLLSMHEAPCFNTHVVIRTIKVYTCYM